MDATNVIVDALSAHFNIKSINQRDQIRQVFRKAHQASIGSSLNFKLLDRAYDLYLGTGVLPDYVLAAHCRLTHA